ncbi:hypothetical protein B0J18DRAFT_485462, partial [Chaetomium sp. MPI-SDFR-AT-0129]
PWANTVANSVYFYAPNQGASIFFASAFAISGLAHIGQCFYYRSWSISSLLPFFCALLTAGYATRSYGSFHYDDPQIYTASLLLIYASPPILALANHLTLTRLFYFVPYHAPLHPSRMVVIFSALTAVTELLTIAGIAYLTDRGAPDKSISVGDTLTKASLVLQLLVTVVFFLLAGTYHAACHRGRIMRNKRVARPLMTAYASMLMVFGRTIYRMAEHFGVPASRKGVDPMSLDPVVRFEWYFLVFDAALMLVGVVVWNLSHPAGHLPGDSRLYLAQDGRTVIKGPGWKDSRSKTETIFNPFATLRTTDGHQKKFWESNGYQMGGRVRRTGVA